MVEKKNRSEFINTFMMLFVLIALFIILSVTTKTFLTPMNLTNILRQISINGLLALGMSLVALTGGIDLSVGSIVGLAGILTAGLLNKTSLPIWIIVVIAVAIGAIAGMMNGYLIAYWSTPPFVITLGMMTILRGITYIYCDGKPISKLPHEFLVIGKGSIGSIPIPFIILLIVFTVFFIMLTRMRHGRHIYAVGGNAQAAMVSGISVKRVIMSVYIFSGICCGIAAVVLTARVSAALPTAGENYANDAIAATVIGGISLAGGTGKLWGTLIGVFLLGMVNTGLDLLNVTSYYQQVIKGLIIIGAVLIDSRRSRAGY